MIDICADEGWLSTTLRVMHLVQMCVQGRWISDPTILTLPHFTMSQVTSLNQVLGKSSLAKNSNIRGCYSLPELLTLYQMDRKWMGSMILDLVQSQHQAGQVYITYVCTYLETGILGYNNFPGRGYQFPRYVDM